MIELDVHTRPDGVAVVTARGRLNMVTARQLKQVLDDLARQGSARVVVDLAETSFLDSSGLGALIGGLKSARQAGGDLRLARPSDAVISVLELTNLDRVLRPRPDVDSAFDD